MRRMAAVLCATALLGVGSQAFGQVGAGAAGMQEADAIWLILDENPRFYFAVGRHYADPAGLRTFAAVGSGPCQVEKSKNMTLIMCSGKGRGKQIPFEDFTIHPGLDNAHLELTSGGEEHIVDWTGRGLASWGGSVSGSGTFVTADAGFYRDATAQGEILGVKLKTNPRWDWHFMIQGAGAMAAGPIDEFTVKRDGSVRVEASFRIPR